MTGDLLRASHSTRRALVEVLGSPVRLAGFLTVSAVVTILYTILLPFEYTQRFGLDNWLYLDPYLLGWAVVLGLGLGLVVSVQVHAMRRIAAARPGSGAAGGVALLASLLPSFLCCTPVIPTLLAFVGLSGVGLYGTTGSMQHFLAAHQTEFLAASFGVLVVAAWWGLHKVGTATCLSETGCDVAERSSGLDTDTALAGDALAFHGQAAEGLIRSNGAGAEPGELR